MAVELGVLSVSLPIPLPKNAVVSKFTVTVTAQTAAEALLSEVATVRVNARAVNREVVNTEAVGTKPAKATAVIDFGTLRTVRGLTLPTVSIVAIRAWNGLAFGKNVAVSFTSGNTASFPEIRTERLELDVSTASGATKLDSESQVALSESPAGLELRLEGGPTIWSHPGPVRLGSGVWGEAGTTEVELASVIAPLVGDPMAITHEPVPFELVLTSRTPAVLGLHVDVVFDHITRISPKPDELSFSAEGRLSAELRLPPSITVPANTEPLIKEVRFSAAGTFAPARVLEPVEPDISADAELAGDSDHTFCVRLPLSPPGGVQPEGDLTGVRLPLRAAAGGAEARIILWAEVNGEPAEPVDGGATEPVSLEPPAGPDEAWTLFSFQRPVPLVKARRFWAALLVARGSVTWRLISAPSCSSFRDNELRRGGPAGPWRRLPSIFDARSPLGALRGRVRSEILPAKATPLAALLVRLGTAPAKVEAVTPMPRGVPVVLQFDPAAAFGDLELTSRAAGTVSLREVDVVWTPRVARSRETSQLDQAGLLQVSAE